MKFQKQPTMQTIPYGEDSGNVYRPKAVLNPEQAIEIYQRRPSEFSDHANQPKLRGQSIPIARNYGVSPKAVRDIWKLKTWVKATKHLQNTQSCDDWNVSNGDQVNPLYFACPYS
jgi:hypothetical protein